MNGQFVDVMGLGHPRVAVVGDIILDRYTWGNVDRVSPEAPVLILDVDRQEVRLGGAASVASMLHGLEAVADLVGVVGDDMDGAQTIRLLESSDMNTSFVGVIAGRTTTSKERFIGKASHRHPHQIVRVDREDRGHLPEAWQSATLDRFAEVCGEYDVVLISDYAKGACPPHLTQSLISQCRKLALPVLIDPARHGPCSHYHGANVLIPNRIEASRNVGWQIDTREEAIQAGQLLCNSYGLDAAVIKLDGDGLVLVQVDGPAKIYPARRREVYDVTGAGDMVMAVFGLMVGCGCTFEEAAETANVAAGLEVERLGVAPVFREEISEEIQRGQLREAAI